MLRCFPKIVYNLFRTRRTRKNNFQEQPRPGSGRKTGSDLGRHLRIDHFRLVGCRDFRKPTLSALTAALERKEAVTRPTELFCCESREATPRKNRSEVPQRIFSSWSAAIPVGISSVSGFSVGIFPFIPFCMLLWCQQKNKQTNVATGTFDQDKTPVVGCNTGLE